MRTLRHRKDKHISHDGTASAEMGFKPRKSDSIAYTSNYYIQIPYKQYSLLYSEGSSPHTGLNYPYGHGQVIHPLEVLALASKKQ